MNPIRRVEHAILFSGGLDSTCAAILRPNALLLRIPSGSRYDAMEKRAADDVGRLLGRAVLHVPGVLNLSQYERDDAIVPGRNAFIVLLAGQYAKRIDLCAVAGDGRTATDKDVAFASMMTELLSKLYGNTIVSIPYHDVGKIELLGRASTKRRTTGRDPVFDSVFSCYAPDEHGTHCGRCKACLRLYVALSVSGYDRPDTAWVHHPGTAKLSEVRAVFAGRGEELAAAAQVYGF